ncbi:PLC-like phosphodiesterase [Cantharellus anzutake]|uniref:PLC-like phosphodiesterase n=1 Tax=Cantharellus anzutake TaxID=1750568 RepID=UPI001904563D|nr:PLC-like phosphodiesterase [Cantharellus anzutake]KAF8334042.1 PLC-like phosphodiesterase [Cantharellus anzutake]
MRGKLQDKEFIVRNATQHPISVQDTSAAVVSLLPGIPTAVTLNSRAKHVIIVCNDKDGLNINIAVPITKALPLKRLENTASDMQPSPYVVYSFMEEALDSKQSTILVLPRRNLSAFLGDFNDFVPLSSLLLPGTHDSVAYYGYPFSQCQSPTFPLPTQLRSGVRTLDIRLAVLPVKAKDPKTGKRITKPTLAAFHGIISQRVFFSSILHVIKEFLAENKTECVVMSLKQEDGARTPEAVFSRLVKEEVYADRSLWFLQNRIPRLGEVRGKIILFSRFRDVGADWPGGDEHGLGLHPTTWPVSPREAFQWHARDHTLVQTHDWYNIGSFLSTPEKFTLATSNLLVPSTSLPPIFQMPSQRISFMSAFTFPLALPPLIALGIKWGFFGWNGVNQRLAAWLLHRFTREHERAANTTVAETRFEKEQSSDNIIDYSGEIKTRIKGINTAMEADDREYDHETKVRGWILLDFVDQPGDLLPLLVECNYR